MKKCLSFLLFLSFLSFSSWSDAKADIDQLKSTSKAFSEIGKKAIPAVVFIKAQFNPQAQNNPNMEDYEDPYDYFSDEFLRRFFGAPPRGPGHNMPQTVGGSGCIVSSDGYILTNHHVIKECNQITVILNTGEEYEAKVIGSDPRTDIAVLKIEAKNLPFLKFGNSDELEVGEWVIAIGSPFALQASFTVGVVSAKGRQNLKITDLEDFIQTDAAINPGNSGGALLNLDAELVGINTAIVSQSGGYMGIGFAIPSNMAKHVMDQIIANGSVKRGYLGIIFQQIDKETAEALNLEKHEGILISEVIKSSAGEKAGLKQGDVVTECDGKPIKSIGSFRNEIALKDPGSKVMLTVLRNGKWSKISVILESSPTEIASAETSPLGLEVDEIKNIAPDILQRYGYNQNMEGLIITKIKRGSIAEKAGLKPGMLLLQVNQKNVSSKEDYQKALETSKNKRHILLLVKFQNITRYVTIKIS